MANFNIRDSEIEQLNERGDNIKIAGNEAPVVVSGRDAAQAVGDRSQAKVGADKPSLFAQLKWMALKCWKYFFGNAE